MGQTFIPIEFGYEDEDDFSSLGMGMG